MADQNSVMTAWAQQETGSFDGFDTFMATRMSDAIHESIALRLEQLLQQGDTAEVLVPWARFSAKVKNVGEGTNTSISYEETEAFRTYLNDDSVKYEDLYLEDLDPELLKLIQEYVAWGYHGVDEKNPEPTKTKGARINNEYVEYFLGSFMRLLAAQAKDHEHEGKSYDIQLGDANKFGTISFDYKDDTIKSRFTADKELKQRLKNDNAGVAA